MKTATELTEIYQRVFDTADGQYVLAELCEFVGFFEEVDITKQPSEVAMVAAQRNVINFIHNRLCVGERDFASLRELRRRNIQEALKNG
jgi:hypothetical protein